MSHHTGDEPGDEQYHYTGDDIWGMTQETTPDTLDGRNDSLGSYRKGIGKESLKKGFLCILLLCFE
ncbi:hypothetical protein GCM10027180_08010 [Microbulbifer echini]